MSELVGRISEAWSPAAQAAREAKHPDWHWHLGNAPGGTPPETRDAAGFVHPDLQDTILRSHLASYGKMGYDRHRHHEAAYQIERGPATLGPRRDKYEPTPAEKRKIAKHHLGAAHADGSGVGMRSAVREHGSVHLKKKLHAAGVNPGYSYRYMEP